MKNMTLLNIEKACRGELIFPGSVREVERIGGSNAARDAAEAAAVVIDSRLVGAGSVFIATRGERVDGHSFIAGAVAKGALGIVCEEAPVFGETEIPYILVQDSFQALRDIAVFYRSQLQIPIVGITGSVGKTSTKEFVAGVLAQKYRVCKTAGNFNNEIGVPLTLLQIRSEHEAAVLEMGINHFGEMHRLSEIARPDICVMTNIGRCHLEFLGSREGVLRAKSEIFDFMNPQGHVCVNGDDDMLATVGQITSHETCHFGLQSSNQIYATDIVSKGLFGMEAMIHAKGGQAAFAVQITIPGEHMVYNALAATNVGLLLGMTTEEISRGIASVQAVGGRSNILKTTRYTIIDDCYNANPASMKAAIDLLTTAPGRKVAVLGDMFELGELEKEMHREVGHYAAQAGIDQILCAGPLATYIAGGAKAETEATQTTLPQISYFTTRDELLNGISSYLKEGDTVLIKASHGMQFEKVVEYLVK